MFSGVPYLHFFLEHLRAALRGWGLIATLIACGVLILSGTLLYLDFNYRHGTHKLLMPDAYTVHLKAGPYTAVVFTQWKSKGIDVRDPAATSLTVQSVADRTYIPVERNDSWAFADKIDAANEGGIWGFVDIPREGDYTISTHNRVVVILTPADHIEMGLGSRYCCPSSDDDFGFE